MLGTRGTTAMPSVGRCVPDVLRSARDDIARLLGYKTHMHKTMEVKMAGKVSAVENMITSLLAAGQSPVQYPTVAGSNPVAEFFGKQKVDVTFMFFFCILII